MASKLGALNAAHASPNAFANASPNSRVGKIAAYQAANAAFTKALSSACQSSSACGSALTAFDTAKANYAANPTAANLAALNQARTALAAAQKAVVQASTTLQALQKAALAALNAAANKHPVTASVRAALNALLAKK